MKFVGHCSELGRAGEGRTISVLGSGENVLTGNGQNGYCLGCRSLIRERRGKCMEREKVGLKQEGDVYTEKPQKGICLKGFHGSVSLG